MKHIIITTALLCGFAAPATLVAEEKTLWQKAGNKAKCFAAQGDKNTEEFLGADCAPDKQVASPFEEKDPGVVEKVKATVKRIGDKVKGIGQKVSEAAGKAMDERIQKQLKEEEDEEKKRAAEEKNARLNTLNG